MDFDKKDQIEYLIKYWKHKGLPSNEIDLIVLPLAEKVYKLLHGFEKLFVAVPLIMKIFAETFEEKIQAQEIIYMYQFFENFVQKKFEVFILEKLKQNPSNDYAKAIGPILRKSLEEKHQKLAIKQLFRNCDFHFFDDDDEMESEEISEKDLEALTKCAIVKIENGALTLSHQAIAEYLASSWFLDKINNKRIAEFLVKVIFQNPDYQIIRLFFEGRMINFDFCLYGNLIRENLDLSDSVLHVACRDGATRNFDILFFTLLKTSNSQDDLQILKKVLTSFDPQGFNVLFYVVYGFPNFRFYLDELEESFGKDFLRECIRNYQNSNLIAETAYSTQSQKIFEYTLVKFKGEFEFLREIFCCKWSNLLHFYCNVSGKILWKYLKVLLWVKRTVGQEFFRETILKRDGVDKNFLFILGQVETSYPKILDWLSIHLDPDDLKMMLLSRNSMGAGILHYICSFVNKRSLGQVFVELLSWIYENYGMETAKQMILMKDTKNLNFLFKLHLQGKKEEVVASIKQVLVWLQKNFPFLEELFFSAEENWNILHQFIYSLPREAISEIFPWIFEWTIEVFGKNSLEKLLFMKFNEGYYPVFNRQFKDDAEVEESLKILDWILENFGGDLTKKTINLQGIFYAQGLDLNINLIVNLLEWTYQKLGPDYTSELILIVNCSISNIFLNIKYHSSRNCFKNLKIFFDWLSTRFPKEFQEELLLSKDDTSLRIFTLFFDTDQKDFRLHTMQFFNFIKTSMGLEMAKKVLIAKDDVGNRLVNFLIFRILKDKTEDSNEAFYEVLSWLGDEFRDDREFLKSLYFAQNAAGTILFNVIAIDRTTDLIMKFLEALKTHLGLDDLKEILLIKDSFQSNFFGYVILYCSEKIIARMLDWIRLTFAKDPEFLREFIFTINNSDCSHLMVFASIQNENHIKLTIGFLEWIRTYLGMESVKEMINIKIVNDRSFFYQLVLTQPALSFKALQEVLRYFKIRFMNDREFVKGFLMARDTKGFSFFHFSVMKVEMNLQNFIIYYFKWINSFLGLETLKEIVLNTDSLNKTFLFLLLENEFAEKEEILLGTLEWLKNFLKNDKEFLRIFLDIRESSGENVIEKLFKTEFSEDFQVKLIRFLGQIGFRGY